MCDSIRTKWSSWIRPIISKPEHTLSLLQWSAILLVAFKGLHLFSWMPSWVVAMIVFIIVVCLFALNMTLIQAHAKLEYKRRIHDPTLALHYQSLFDQQYLKKRLHAAEVLLKHNPEELQEIEKKESELYPIDDLLDFFEDLGFYAEGDQISQVVVHNHFYYWFQGYWSKAHFYAEAWQQKDKDPARWEHIQKLFDLTSQIEASKGGVKLLTLEKANEFLESEIEEMKEKLKS